MSDSIVEKYFNAHQALDLDAMHACQHPDYTFSDPAFPTLDTKHSKGMWAMFIENKDVNKMKMTYSNLKALGDNKWSVDYKVEYLFGKKPVVNNIHSEVTVCPETGLVKRQVDSFNFWDWSSQSLGYTGKLLGWTSYLQKQVQSTAQGKLASFVSKRDSRTSPENAATETAPATATTTAAPPAPAPAPTA